MKRVISVNGKKLFKWEQYTFKTLKHRTKHSKLKTNLFTLAFCKIVISYTDRVGSIGSNPNYCKSALHFINNAISVSGGF